VLSYIARVAIAMQGALAKGPSTLATLATVVQILRTCDLSRYAPTLDSR